MATIQPFIGHYYEDFQTGDTYKHWPGRTISEADNTWFTLLTMNTHPAHFDANYAAQTMYKQRLVVSPLTLAIVTGMTVREISQCAVANLTWDEIRMPAPVFIGDTLYAESEILNKRESNSRPGMGLVTVATRGYNQENVIVISFKRTLLIKCKGYDEGRIPSFGSQS